MMLSARYLVACTRLLMVEMMIALYERAEPLSPAFAQVAGLKSLRREILSTLREIEDEQQ